MGPEPVNEDALAEQRTGALDRMEADRERLGEGGLGGSDMVGDLHRLALLDDQHLAEARPWTWGKRMALP